MAERGEGQPDLAAFGAMVEAEEARRLGRDTRETWQAVAEAWRVAGWPYREAYARLHEAAAALKAGRREQATRALTACQSAARELRAAPLLDPSRRPRAPGRLAQRKLNNLIRSTHALLHSDRRRPDDWWLAEPVQPGELTQPLNVTSLVSHRGQLGALTQGRPRGHLHVRLPSPPSPLGIPGSTSTCRPRPGRLQDTLGMSWRAMSTRRASRARSRLDDATARARPSLSVARAGRWCSTVRRCPLP